jgi:hypothetical protein
MKTKTSPAAAQETAKPVAEQLMVGTTKFTALAAPEVRGTPIARFTCASGKPSKGALRFNAPLCLERPELLQIQRAKIFLAEDRPAILVVPATDGARFHKGKSGDIKACGSVFAVLGKLYQRIDYRLEKVSSPRAGWLLHPRTSERHEA